MGFVVGARRWVWIGRANYGWSIVCVSVCIFALWNFNTGAGRMTVYFPPKPPGLVLGLIFSVALRLLPDILDSARATTVFHRFSYILPS